MRVPLVAILMWALLATSLATSLASRDHGRLSAAQPQKSETAAPADVDRIVSAFTAKETEFRSALDQYRFKRDAVVQTIGAGKQVSGEYHRTSQFVFDGNGKRIEKVLFFPSPTLSGTGVTPEDLDELGGVPLFALEASKASLYNFKYAGKERIDDFDLHIFDVSPKAVPDPKKVKDRFFQGRIWVDTENNQIVKTRGKGVPEPKNSAYLTVEIFREEIAAGLWFPTYAYADEELTLGTGDVVHLRMKVRVSEFEKVTRR